jgi:glyoxylase-like metal-dependent hydrolase (beta-lactamase superfamily II)
MKKNNFPRSTIVLSLLTLLTFWIIYAFKPVNSTKNFSLAASKIAPLFKSAVYKDGSGNVLPYRFFEPSLQINSDNKLPVVLYLHGEQESGSDNEIQLIKTECASIWVESDHLAKNPVFVLAPQIPKGSDWNSEPVYSKVLSLLKQFIANHPNIDSERIYIVGFSMGGTGVWNMILKNPSLFAAAMPISGNADDYLGNSSAFEALKNLPVLVVHSVDDPVSPVSGANNAMAALTSAGNRCVGNNSSIWGMGSVIPAHDAWFPAFHNYEVIYNWLFEQSLKRSKNGNISPNTLFTTRNLANDIKQVWDYSLGTAYIIERQDKAIIIDAGAGDGNIYQFIKDQVLRNKNIALELIVTHNHFDHIVGLASFVGASQVKKVYVHQQDSEAVRLMLGGDAEKIQYVSDGDQIPLEGQNIEVISVPGHTWGSIVLKYGNTLFTGDAIGSGGVWLFGSALSIEQYIKSLEHLLDKTGKNKLSLLPGHTAENRSPLTGQYIEQMMACAKGLVDGSITGTPFCRTFSDVVTLGNIATIGQASVIYNLSNIHTIKGALRNLTISQGNLNPRFAPYTAYYLASVNADIKSVTISPAVLAQGFDHVSVNGHALDSSNAYEANLTSGENRFSIAVTAPDNTAKIYTLTITKAK